MSPDNRSLLETELASDPIEQFSAWFEEAAETLRMPEAVALATATPDGRPSARMVLMKRFDARGFVFHTNYESRKATEIEANPRGALLFYWNPPGRQVRIEGGLEHLPAEESDQYFATRPHGAQIAAHVSRQSQPVASRQALDARVEELSAAFEGQTIPRPARWGGYLLIADSFEFWQDRQDRLHDRFRYSRSGQGWLIERLQP